MENLYTSENALKGEILLWPFRLKSFCDFLKQSGPAHKNGFTSAVIWRRCFFPPLHSNILASLTSFSFSSPFFHPKLTHSPFGPWLPPPPTCNLPAVPLRWWLPIDHWFTQSFAQCSNCVFYLCEPHREGIDHRLMRGVVQGGGGASVCVGGVGGRE